MLLPSLYWLCNGSSSICSQKRVSSLGFTIDLNPLRELGVARRVDGTTRVVPVVPQTQAGDGQHGGELVYPDRLDQGSIVDVLWHMPGQLQGTVALEY